MGPETARYLRWLVSGVVRNRGELDRLIIHYAPDWPVDQLAIIDRNVLRLALFEFGSHESDAPAKVVINEAVELAKRFGERQQPTVHQWCVGLCAERSPKGSILMDSFFGIGMFELIMIAVIALLVMGPERLPGAMREIAKYMRQLRNISDEFQSQFSEELKLLDEINPKRILNEALDPNAARQRPSRRRRSLSRPHQNL